MTSLYRLLASAFPGGYRFLAVNLIAISSSPLVSDSFARAFFTVSLLTTFSGVAISTQSFVSGRHISLVTRSLYLLILLALVAVPVYIFWEESLNYYLIVLVSASFYSLFEMIRADLRADGKFKELVVSGFGAVILLPLPILLFPESGIFLTFFIFLVLFASVLYFVDKPFKGDVNLLNTSVIKDIISYSASNGLSTALAFVIPLLLANELGDGGATQLGQVYTLAMLAYFYPRYLSSGFMVNYRRNNDWSLVRQFTQKVAIYSIFIIAIYMLAAFFFFESLLYYTPLFSAFILSQVSLPYSNFLMIHGQGGVQLKVNFYSFVLLISPLIIIHVFVEQGHIRAYYIIYCYLLLMVIRFVTLIIFSSKYKNNFIKQTKMIKIL